MFFVKKINNVFRACDRLVEGRKWFVVSLLSEQPVGRLKPLALKDNNIIIIPRTDTNMLISVRLCLTAVCMYTVLVVYYKTSNMAPPWYLTITLQT